ncbi:hypothetical protein GCM10009718_13360 [Isoptericola halotolerans]|uniref:Uncharacterized protein n=1 Tax=Isoptericola halotolerans TaxID=300560 RepID=A0ABX1ZYQ9_9MICO|nr:hypothetical protein [Isoptericola halotolerans]NOV95744.1 hypothetical protein [Isoptericola halotolerans]
MPADELVDPLPWAWPWTFVGVAVLLLTVAVVVLTVRLTRPAPVPEPAAPAPAPEAQPVDRFAAARAATLGRIDDLDRRWRDDEIDDRALHLALRQELRRFAAVRTGHDVSTMTVGDLRDLHGTKTFGREMERLLEPTFGPDGRRIARPHRSLQRARSFVRRW